MSLRAWPPDFPDDIAAQRRVPYEARADSVMYRQVLAELVRERGWEVNLYDAKAVERQAASTACGRGTTGYAASASRRPVETPVDDGCGSNREVHGEVRERPNRPHC